MKNLTKLFYLCALLAFFSNCSKTPEDACNCLKKTANEMMIQGVKPTLDDLREPCIEITEKFKDDAKGRAEIISAVEEISKAIEQKKILPVKGEQYEFPSHTFENILEFDKARKENVYKYYKTKITIKHVNLMKTDNWGTKWHKDLMEELKLDSDPNKYEEYSDWPGVETYKTSFSSVSFFIPKTLVSEISKHSVKESYTDVSVIDYSEYQTKHDVEWFDDFEISGIWLHEGMLDRGGRISANRYLFVQDLKPLKAPKKSAKTDGSSTNKIEESKESTTAKPIGQEFIGEWKGSFGNDQIIINIESISNDGNVSGYNIVKNNKRPLNGKLNGNEFILNEPGDDKWDGVFKFKIDNNIATGSWTSNNKKLFKEYSLKK